MDSNQRTYSRSSLDTSKKYAAILDRGKARRVRVIGDDSDDASADRSVDEILVPTKTEVESAKKVIIFPDNAPKTTSPSKVYEFSSSSQSPIKDTSPLKKSTKLPVPLTIKLTPISTAEPVLKKLHYNNRTFDIDKNAIQCLGDKRMINDTIVEFYTNYLMEKAPDAIRQKFHLFNTFFYHSLKKSLRRGSSDSDTNKQYSIAECDQEIPASLRRTARRWDKEVRIFNKDFLVIPICEYGHWNLIIVCCANLHDPEIIEEAKRPSIVLFDSLCYRTKFPCISMPIRKFLSARWSCERSDQPNLDFTKESVITDVSAKVPRQKNAYDCGIHMLHTFEKFLSDPWKAYELLRDRKDLGHRFVVDCKQKRSQIFSLVI